MWTSNCPNTICSKYYPFPIELPGTVVKNQLTINLKAYFWTISSVPLSYIFDFMLVPHWLDYYCSAVNFKLGNVNPPALFFFSKIVSVVLGPLDFNMNFRVSL